MSPLGHVHARRTTRALRRRWLTVAAMLGLIVAFGLPARRARAQSWTTTSPNLNVSAVVLSPLTASALTHLVFGTLLPGDSAVVQASTAGVPNASAAVFDVRTAASNRFLYVSFVLPPVLTNSVNGATIPVDWNGTRFGALCEVQSTTSCVNVQTFNPSLYPYPVPLQYQLTLRGNNRDVHVHVGGRILTSVDQSAGDYVGTITLRFYSTN